MQDHDATITNDLLIAAAKKFYNMSHKDPSQKELQFSNRWLEGFKRRFKIKDYTRHGETSSAENSPEALQRMKPLLEIGVRCKRNSTRNSVDFICGLGTVDSGSQSRELSWFGVGSMSK